MERRHKTDAHLFTFIVLTGFLFILLAGCGGNEDDTRAGYKTIEGLATPFAHPAISGASVILAIENASPFPMVEVAARLVPPFELPRRQPGGTLRLHVRSVLTKSGLNIFDPSAASSGNRFAGVIWMNFDHRLGLWAGTLRVNLSGFQPIPLENLSRVDGTLVLRLPKNPVSVEFGTNDGGGRYEVNGVRFEIAQLSSKKVEMSMPGDKKNYIGMDALVNGRWVQTLGQGRSVKKTSHDQVVMETHRISVEFPQPAEAIKLYFSAGFASIESDVSIRPNSPYRKELK